ncbi:unnamed protein product, partial [Ixodes hexagonus]
MGSAAALAQPPDGGWGWVVVLSSFMIHVIADGVTYTFGIFYLEFLKYFQESKGKTAWIASIMVGTTFCIGKCTRGRIQRQRCLTTNCTACCQEDEKSKSGVSAVFVSFLCLCLSLCFTGFYTMHQLAHIKTLTAGLSTCSPCRVSNDWCLLIDGTFIKEPWAQGSLGRNEMGRSLSKKARRRQCCPWRQVAFYSPRMCTKMRTKKKKPKRGKRLLACLKQQLGPTFNPFVKPKSTRHQVWLSSAFFRCAPSGNYMMKGEGRKSIQDQGPDFRLVRARARSKRAPTLGTKISLTDDSSANASEERRFWYRVSLSGLSEQSTKPPYCQNTNLETLMVLLVCPMSPGAFVSLTSVILVDILGLERLTNAFGLLLLFEGVACLVGPPMTGWLYDFTGSYDPGFFVSGAMIALGGIMLFLIPCVQNL